MIKNQKKEIDELVSKAYDVIKKDLNEKKLPKQYKGYVASFAASLSMGGVLTAIAFFYDDGQSEKKRSKILDYVAKIMDKKDRKGLCEEAKKQNIEKKKIINATLAVKLAMNLFEEESDDEKGE